MLKSSILSVMEQTGYYIFASALRASDHCALAEGEGAFTVFAPVDAAFSAYTPVHLDKFLRQNREQLNRVVGYHIAAGVVLARRFAGRRIRATMQEGGRVLIDGKNGLRVNAARIVTPDLQAINGVVHGIDALLEPHVPRISTI